MNCSQLKPDYLLYAMGTMEEPERAEMRGHLERGCEICIAGVREAQTVAYGMGAGVEGPSPPRMLRDRVLAIARPDRVTAASQKMPFWKTLVPAWQALSLGAACLALVAIPASISFRQSAEQGAKQTETTARLQTTEGQVAALRDKLAQLESAAPQSVPIFALELSRGGGDSGEPLKQLSIPPVTPAIVLALPSDLVRQADAIQVQDASGHTIWSATQLPAGNADSAGVTIPAKLLPPGRYLVRLMAGGRSIASLPFIANRLAK